jgi:hypothetical protein
VDVENPVRAVVAVPLSDGVSLTLLLSDAGWQFGSWTHHDGKPVQHQPALADRRRRFRSKSAAIEYFRSLWPGGRPER